MKGMINRFVMIVSLLLICFFANAGEKGKPVPLDLPEEVFALLADAATQECILCAKQMRQDAFHVLEDRLQPGSIIQSNDSCLFARAHQCRTNELMLTCYPATGKDGKPLLSFRFHTAQNKLVGIAEKDLTDNRFAEIYRSISAGVLFRGELETVHYPYGDGKTFNYHARENILQVHCKIRSLKPFDKREEKGSMMDGVLRSRQLP